ncbi:MAG: hypothetical protein ACI9O1_000327 [Candidatus Thalassarchaeaceae archaeon]|jgi:hypothetical protein
MSRLISASQKLKPISIQWIFTIVWCVLSSIITQTMVPVIISDIGTSDWTPVKGTILDSGVYASTYNGTTTYCLWVDYDYEIKGETYSNSLISYSHSLGCDSGLNAEYAYPPGNFLTVYVNPINYYDSVLLRGFSGIDSSIYLFILAPLFGIILILITIKSTISLLFSGNYVNKLNNPTKRFSRTKIPNRKNKPKVSSFSSTPISNNTKSIKEKKKS